MQKSCEMIMDHLDAYLDDRLAASQKAVLDEHLAVCEHCCQLLEQARDYFSAVHSLPLVDVPEQLHQRILDSRFPGAKAGVEQACSSNNHAEEMANPPAPASLNSLKWRYFGAGAAVATAAAVTLAMAMQVFIPGGQQAGQNMIVEDSAVTGERAITKVSSSVLAIQNQARHIYFLVESPRALEDVTFSVMVPPTMRLQGYSKRHTLVWKGRLQQGENLLSLPLVATAATPGVVVMRIDHRHARKEYQVKVDVLSS